MAALQFPTSSAPGGVPGEGSGRLINALSLGDGAEVRWVPAPGLDSVATTGVLSPRGGLLVGDALLLARADNLYALNAGYTLARIGALPGSRPVTMARDNYAAPSDVSGLDAAGKLSAAQAIAVGGPHVVAVTDNGVFIVARGAVLPYPANSSSSASIGVPTSVAFQDGYFFFLYADGTLRATGTNATPLNTLDFSDQSFTKCQSAPQNWLRVTATSGQLWCFGESTIEVYTDQALTPFPYARAQVISVGLLGPSCVAGFEPGWDGQQIFVAADRSVRMMNGYTPTRISPRAVERSIAATEPSVIRACCYTFGGNAIFSLSSPAWTWEYNATTQQWHERRSQGLNRWRGETSVNAFGHWYLGDITDGSIVVLNANSRLEGTAPVVSRIESAPLRNTPDRIRLGRLSVDITTGQGLPTNADAACLIDWSLDGGGKWSQALTRSIGGPGRYGQRVQVGDLGRSTREGVRVGITVSDPVAFSLRGADLPNVETRRGG